MIPADVLSMELHSSTLTRATYLPESAILQLEFRDGSVYRYAPLPQSLHQDLLQADSPGTFFNLRIRGRFLHLRVRLPR